MFLMLMFIYVECDSGTYGVNCEESCGEFCEDKNCDHKDGKCSCTTWGLGDICDHGISKLILYYIYDYHSSFLNVAKLWCHMPLYIQVYTKEVPNNNIV